MTIKTPENLFVLGIMQECKIYEVSNYFPEIINQTSQLAFSQGLSPLSGINITHNFNPETQDVSFIGGIVTNTLGKSNEKIQAFEIVGNPSIVVEHTGGYEAIPHIFQRIRQFALDNWHKLGSKPYYQYLNDPFSTHETEYKTRIVWPLG